MPSLLAQVATDAAGSGAEVALFWIFAAIGIGSAVAVVALRNIVHAALMLVVNLLSIAALYLGLQSSFLSIVQVIIYAGAIVVLFLFVIMLLGVDRDDLLGTRSPLNAVAAVVAGVALAGALLVVLGDGSLTAASACGAQAAEGAGGAGDAVACAGLDEESADSVRFVGQALFTRWTFAFEASALLLVVATLGALVLGRRRDPVVGGDLDDRVGADADGLATSELRPERDATATLDGVEDRDPADTAADHVAGQSVVVEDAPADGGPASDADTTERDA